MQKKIVVIGDVMLDMYDYCKNRENPESSAPCYTVISTEYKPGGAGNVAACLAKLGANLKLISVVGKDYPSDNLVMRLDELNIPYNLIRDEKRQTVLKERTLSVHDGRYHYRKDREVIQPIELNHIDEIVRSARDADFIIISDYAKGIITYALMEELKKMKIPIFVDPKPNHLSYYKRVSIITPNVKEAREMSGISDEMKAAEKLKQELETNVLLTRSEKGMSYFGLTGEIYDFPAEAKEVFDVTGAGDSVIATFAHFIAKEYSIKDALSLANKAAGISVGHTGCYQVTEKELGIGIRV